MLGVGGAKKTYLDDVFRTHVYIGAGETQTITNGIDLSGEGGLVWVKSRSGTTGHSLYDTERGVNKVLSTHLEYPYGAQGTQGGGLQQFNSNGFQFGYTGGAYAELNASGGEFSSWTFRKTKGFLDIVTYTGTGSTQNISHSLGSIPGVIIIKGVNNASEWTLWHKDTASVNHYLELNKSEDQNSNTNYFASTAPTSTQFTVGSDAATNGNTNTYVAYIFAGGESTAATARCVEMDGTGDYFATSTSSDYTFGTGDFTVETWVRIDEDYVANNNYPTILDARTDDSYTNFWVVYVSKTDKTIRFYTAGGDRITSNIKIESGQWYHIAVVRNSGVTQFYVNGTSQGTYSDSIDYSHTSIVWGSNAIALGSYAFDGALSNLRVVKGTAVYTSSFRPPTEPLTNITNTKLLCFNNSSTTGTTVGTITASGNPTASTDSPFDDPAAFTFGDSQEGIIKCGSYVGNDAADGPEVNLGWEPQWLLIKRIDDSSNSRNWLMFDSIRGITAASGHDSILRANTTDDEEDDVERLDLTPTGFKLTSGSDTINNGNFIYMAIRRPDPLVGKPADAATDVFAMDTGNSSSTTPAFDSNFVVDMFLAQQPASAGLEWRLTTRLNTPDKLPTNTTAAESDESPNNKMDSNVGVGQNYASAWQAWMWKRHAGFDAVTTKGGSGKLVPHNLNAVPEMIWLKARDSAQDWRVYHHGVNGGTNPEQYGLTLNTSGGQNQNQGYWNNVAPTATHFSTGTWTSSGGDSSVNYIMMLFASVSGISKCGQYTPASGSTSTTVTCGFSPRLVIVKCVDAAGSWHVGDTLRGISSSGNDPVLMLNESWEQDAYGARNWLEVSSTGFTVKSVSGGTPDANRNGDQYIYYAHA